MREVVCVQYSPEWWAVRRGVPTASQFSRILTPTGKPSAARHAYAHQLIAEHYYDYYAQEPEYQSEAMESGSLLEPKAKRHYEFARDCEVTECGFIFADGDRAGSSPDALVGDRGTLESKSPLPKTHIGYVLADKVPSKYKPQCHGHILVTGRDWCDFQSFLPGFPPIIVRVERDEYTEKLAKALDEFCDLYAELLAKVKRKLDDYILGERPTDQTPKELKSFIA